MANVTADDLGRVADWLEEIHDLMLHNFFSSTRRMSAEQHESMMIIYERMQLLRALSTRLKEERLHEE